MIDVITLSRTPEKVERLAASLPLAIGNLAPWKLTVVDGNTHDIFTGYNKGAADTRGDLLMFVHDDMVFWSNPLTLVRPIEALARPDIGFIGVAGTARLERHCVWSDSSSEDHRRGCVYHGASDLKLVADIWPQGKCALFSSVVVLDGVLLFCHRRTFEKLNGFDSESYKGFHYYDIDITFRASLGGMMNFAVPIPILHASGGKRTPEWEVNRQIFFRKFGHLLPAKLD